MASLFAARPPRLAGTYAEHHARRKRVGPDVPAPSGEKDPLGPAATLVDTDGDGSHPATVAPAGRVAAGARAAAAALVLQALRHAGLLRPAGAAQVGQGAAAAPAEGEAADDVGFDAGVGRSVRADLGLEVRRRLRRAAVPARARPLHPA